MKFKIVAAAALAAMAGFAQAATHDWGVHDIVEAGGGFASGAGTSLSDTYKFNLSSQSGVLAVAVSNDGGFFNLTGGKIELFKEGSATAIGSFSFDKDATSFSFGSLLAGNYFYTVTGKVASDAFAATYQLNSQLAPVPEPETYALMLAGLGAVAFVARRRKQQA